LPVPDTNALSPALERILDAAHWAPSGDNAQPWSFEIKGENDVVVSIHRERGNVYEYRDGEPTVISAGTLLENIAIAAPSVGKAASWTYTGSDAAAHHIAVHFEPGPTARPELLDEIARRTVDRRAYRMRPLTPEAKAMLTKAAAPDIAVEWYESLKARRRIAGLTNQATDIRLRIREAYDVHRRIVDWERLQSPTGIPSRALGLDAMTLKIMRWSMAEWKRTDFGNRMGSTLFAGLQMDVLPGICSAAYFALRPRAGVARGAERIVQLLRAGQSVQRLWLTASRLGLAMQPCQAVLAFTHYGASGEAFTQSSRERASAGRLAGNAEKVLSRPEELVFLARIGFPGARAQESRSIRKELASLIQAPAV
jgi:sulfur-carrier protein adenylyltransferase/sulfurtransferase